MRSILDIKRTLIILAFVLPCISVRGDVRLGVDPADIDLGAGHSSYYAIQGKVTFPNFRTSPDFFTDSGAGEPNETRTITYTYDNLNRLIKEVGDDDPNTPDSNGYTVEYEYDLVGNRISRSVWFEHSSSELYTECEYNQSDQLLRETYSNTIPAQARLILHEGPYYAHVINDSLYYTKSGSPRKIGPIRAYMMGLPSVLSHYLFGIAMLLLVIAFLLPAIMHIFARAAGRQQARIRLSLWHRCVLVFLAYALLIGPFGFEQLARSSTQYSQLGVSTWGASDRIIEYGKWDGENPRMGTFTPGYDENGSQTEKLIWDSNGTEEPNDDQLLEEVTYEYNLQNRLSHIETDYQDGTVDITEYQYNTSGIRTRKQTWSLIEDDHQNDDVTTVYLVDTQNHTGYAQVLEEMIFNSSNPDPINDTPADLITYTIADDILSQAADSGTARQLLYDGHGSTRQLVSGTAGSTTIHDDFSYDAYGTMLQNESTASSNPAKTPNQPTNLLYAGEHFDTDAQSYYLRARWYDQNNGRFNRMDDYSGSPHDPQSLHKYLYAHCNPVNNIDPSGMFTMKGLFISIGIGALVGAIAGGIYAKLTNKNIWKGIFIGAALGAISGAAIYLLWSGFAAVKSGALKRFFWNPRAWSTVSRQYWQRFGPAARRSLHHWLMPQSWSWIPQGIRNAGFNLLRMRHILSGNLGLNQWMGFAVRWGGTRMVVAMLVENGIRVLIPVTAVATYHAGRWLGNELAEETIEFADGSTATPINLTPEEEVEMQDDTGEALLTELDHAQ